MRVLLIVVCILLLLGAFPLYGLHPYYGYSSGGIGLVLMILLILAVTGNL